MPIERKHELETERSLYKEKYAKRGKYFLDLEQLIIDRMGVENMITSWKKHFTDTMKPKYLPSWWDVDHIKVVER